MLGFCTFKMNFLSHHHHSVLIAACLGGLIILLLIIIRRVRSRKRVDEDADLESHRIEARLASGQFSRSATPIRRKVIDIQDHKKEGNGDS